jgi:hypothetical protein
LYELRSLLFHFPSETVSKKLLFLILGAKHVRSSNYVAYFMRGAVSLKSEYLDHTSIICNLGLFHLK